MTYIVVRFNCESRNVSYTEQAMIGLCTSLVAARGTPYEVAEKESKVFSLYQTEEPTAYREVVEELAFDAEGSQDLLDEALTALREEVREHPDWQEATSEEQRRDEKRGLYGEHEDPCN